MKPGENIYTVAANTEEELRWMIEFNYLPSAKRGDSKAIDDLKEIYDERFNPYSPVDRTCPGCIAKMIEVVEALIVYWNK